MKTLSTSSLETFNCMIEQNIANHRYDTGQEVCIIELISSVFSMPKPLTTGVFLRINHPS